MASDQLVPARLILKAELELQRRGTSPVMEDLEQAEPDLAGYLMETLSCIHSRLLELGGRPKQTRRLQRQITSLTLVCIMAQRQGHYELWRRESEGGPGQQADQPAQPPPKPPSAPAGS